MFDRDTGNRSGAISAPLSIRGGVEAAYLSLFRTSFIDASGGKPRSLLIFPSLLFTRNWSNSRIVVAQGTSMGVIALLANFTIFIPPAIVETGFFHKSSPD